MKQFTDIAISRLKVTGTRYHVTEGGGLYLVVNAKGQKTWCSYYRGQDNKRHWHTLGVYPTIGLADARGKNSELQKLVEKGVDPANITDGLSLDPSLKDVFDLFIKKGVDRKGNPLSEKTLQDYRYIFDKNILKYIGQRKVRELRKRDILPVLEKIIERKAFNQANQAYRRLHRVLAFAAARDLIEVSPMASMEPIGTTNKRQRILTADEIKTLLTWDNGPDDARRILKLILITGARPGEVSGMRKTEINGNWWTIPAERVKTRIPHRVYLTDMAKALLPEDTFNMGTSAAISKALRRARTGRELKKNPPSPTLLIKEPFVPHDLRRTMATGLAALGFTDEVINAVQGRAKLGIIGTYNLHTYDLERQKAAEAWTRKLISILRHKQTDNVVSLRKRSNK